MIYITPDRESHLLAVEQGLNDCVDHARRFDCTKETAYARLKILEALGLLTSEKVDRKSGKGGYIAKFTRTDVDYEVRHRKPYSRVNIKSRDMISNYERKGADFFMKHVKARVCGSVVKLPLWAAA